MFGNYPYQGAASKNKAAIEALELQMKGISNFVTDYSYLVEEPVENQKQQLAKESMTVEDPVIELENNRKANFDLKK
jgi:hypothetical protein